MKDRLIEIELNGVNYPLIYNLNVMEELENKYNTIDEWINKLRSSRARAKDIKYTLMVMMNEGIEIENIETGSDRKKLTEKEVGRILYDYVLAMDKITEAAIAGGDTGEGKNVLTT